MTGTQHGSHFDESSGGGAVRAYAYLCIVPASESNATISRHKSIIAYLAANNLPNTAAALRAELNLGEDVFDTGTAKKYESLLQKKWTSVVRLQKKVSAISRRSCAPSLPQFLQSLTLIPP